MTEIRFEWDTNKALANIEKHGVSFEEASTVFSDAFAVVFDDPDHSDDEERYLILGFSLYANILIVCHCLRGDESIIRIISARKATRREEMQYAEINEGWAENERRI